MSAPGLSEIVFILILWGIPLAIILSRGSFVISPLRPSNARHARIVDHLGPIESELRRVREDLYNAPLPAP